MELLDAANMIRKVGITCFLIKVSKLFQPLLRTKVMARAAIKPQHVFSSVRAFHVLHSYMGRWTFFGNL
jgi:hypothetical protein